ncbi:hypothetical protein MAR_020828 [Mya arenaria]|uniref:Ig-like domain-containing protein n=1 Tax=Mya arenaria TaxID=6604 RepID=A0ABY7E8D4_MYAAR|nr:hypothetical protein MAR_020828 [Mya arenaria]
MSLLKLVFSNIFLCVAFASSKIALEVGRCGEDTKIVCSGTDTFAWNIRKNGYQIAGKGSLPDTTKYSVREYPTNVVLTIHNTSVNDGGSYNCEVANDGRSETKDLQLNCSLSLPRMMSERTHAGTSLLRRRKTVFLSLSESSRTRRVIVVVVGGIVVGVVALAVAVMAYFQIPRRYRFPCRHTSGMTAVGPSRCHEVDNTAACELKKKKKIQLIVIYKIDMLAIYII